MSWRLYQRLFDPIQVDAAAPETVTIDKWYHDLSGIVRRLSVIHTTPYLDPLPIPAAQPDVSVFQMEYGLGTHRIEVVAL